MEKIISKNNIHIIEASKLKQVKHRKETGRFLAEGEKVIKMAIDSGYTLESLFIDEDKERLFENLVKKSLKTGTKTFLVSSQAVAKIASSKSPQGVFAVVKMEKYDINQAQGDLIIACENLSDPGNMGTIMRTADAVGVKTLLLSADCVDIYNDKVIRASMGSIFNVEAIIADDFVEGLNFLHEKGYNVACGHLNGEDFFASNKHEKNVLVIGNESRGVSEEAEAVCESLWKLPMYGGAESLNAAVAAGIMMYDIVRNKQQNNNYKF